MVSLYELCFTVSSARKIFPKSGMWITWPNVCAGGGICADFAVVDTCGAAFGQNAGDTGAIPGGAVRLVVERGADRDDYFVCSPGNAGQVDGKWKDVVADQLGSAGDCVDADPGGLVVELRRSSNRYEIKKKRTKIARSCLELDALRELA